MWYDVSGCRSYLDLCCLISRVKAAVAGFQRYNGAPADVFPCLPGRSFLHGVGLAETGAAETGTH